MVRNASLTAGIAVGAVIAFEALPALEYDAVVAMGCGDEGCPLVRAKRREEWNIPDPKELPPDRFREIRDLIEKKVKELLHGL